MMRRTGFTLIETLIAVALVAAVLPVALAGVSRAGQAASEGHRRQLALHLAQNKLNELVASGDWANGATSGNFDAVADGDEATAFRWQLESTPWRDPAVHALRVTVGWGEPAAPARQVALETLVVEATAPDAADTPNAGGGE